MLLNTVLKHRKQQLKRWREQKKDWKKKYSFEQLPIKSDTFTSIF